MDETIESLKEKILSKPDSSKAELNLNIPGIIVMMWSLLVLFTDWFSFSDYYGWIPWNVIMKLVAIIALLGLARMED